MQPVVFGGDDTGRAFDNQVMAICAGAPTNVLVVDEFWG
jgi:hypothetical protein